MTMALTSRSTTVLDLQFADAGVAFFAAPPEDDEDELFPSVSLPEHRWIAMDSPDKLTVTLEPGDQLNLEGEPA
jgi:hypothetical protein